MYKHLVGRTRIVVPDIRIVVTALTKRSSRYIGAKSINVKIDKFY